MEPDDWFTLAELGERLGALVWAEQQLCDVLTGWSKLEPIPQAAILFATAGHHHGWHSEIISQCLPTSPQLREVEVVAPPTVGWAESVGTLRGLVDPNASAVRLRSLVKVIDPWLALEIGSLRELARPISDAALQRWLRFVTIDHDDDHAAMATLLAAVTSQTPSSFDDHVLLSSLDLQRDTD